LVTYGSHVPGLYRRSFPTYFNAEQVETLKGTLSTKPASGWHNFFRSTDPIGVAMFVDSPRDHRLDDPTCTPPRPAVDDPAAPREMDLERCHSLSIHSYYPSERDLKEKVDAMKAVLMTRDAKG
jgi:hypothetical protein